MKNIYAPWRMKYIVAPKKDERCIFCCLPQEDCDEENMILFRGDKCFVIMNAFPYNPGHLMVAPYLHTAEFESLDSEILLEMQLLAGRCLKALDKSMSPQGFNMGINIGKVAGAGIDCHLHLHIVPRWNGDTNFMPVLSDVRVVAESLNETYIKLKRAWS
ncbi:MAG: HIT domain-containing protein [Synergistaceae bacterium]|nr:HIT domain-containing protein [Synergistota bacterium]NLM70510.1 HIT domain-containing protein [Synergistaceae bacterium]